ncbi:arginase family protein [Bosea sp. 685]|uniref:arginase family protein n=1 Tax=Bosea sp. 685 TaxID=3080057 RepID=UPI002892FB76|nr:arginase family protein [Bosea sp. 685]WNJ89607.1 arginase family protein [Bosea sp. 685]
MSSDPLPPWCLSKGTLFNVPPAGFSSNGGSIDVGVCSIAFDSTASTHIGARHGPNAIRAASARYSAQMNSRGRMELLNLRTGVCLSPISRNIVDFGDLHVYPTDPARQIDCSIEETAIVAAAAQQMVMLGGEHTVSYPSFAGVNKALFARGQPNLGYVQIDHHFDFGDLSSLHGRYYHGSNARRIAELPFMSPKNMGFVGQGDMTSLQQFRSLIDGGYTVSTIRDVKSRSYETCLRETLDKVCSASPGGVYISVDIDVCDCSTAPGTGNVTIGGISASEFISTADVIRHYPVKALDIVEVNPSLDRSGRTAELAARFLYEYLMLAPASCETI